jgi:hypothetical protein
MGVVWVGLGGGLSLVGGVVAKANQRELEEVRGFWNDPHRRKASGVMLEASPLIGWHKHNTKNVLPGSSIQLILEWFDTVKVDSCLAVVKGSCQDHKLEPWFICAMTSKYHYTVLINFTRFELVNWFQETTA